MRLLFDQLFANVEVLPGKTLVNKKIFIEVFF